MDDSIREGTETLQEIADEVVKEREEAGGTAFDAPDDSADESVDESDAPDDAPEIPVGSVERIAHQNSPQR